MQESLPDGGLTNGRDPVNSLPILVAKEMKTGLLRGRTVITSVLRQKSEVCLAQLS